MKLETAREKQIDAYIATNDVKEDEKMRVVLKGQPKPLEVYRIPIKLLIYNIRNGRFAAELLAKETELKRKLDAANPQDAKVIQNLLLDLNPAETEALREDLKKNGQLDPGVISRDGAVINANRRMSILSALHDEKHDPKFEYLRVARLPKDVDEQDIWRIEAGLQFAKEFRLDYSPVNELLKLREGRESGLTPPQISQALLGRFTASKVEEKLAILKLIESYLEFIAKPRQYHIVQEERDVEKFNSLQANVVAPLKRKGLKEGEIAKLLTFAFSLIQKTDLRHWDIRLLSKIAAEPAAHVELFKNYNFKNPNGASKETLEESFTTAKEILDAQASHNKPERLLKKALSALQGIASNNSKLGDPAMKTLLTSLKKEVERLMSAKAK
ncbi:MAG TPA: hypothetical protein VK763_04490 [Terriglobales bacterium]|jgi:hypothetical protein|nr:hypothetical protein [Terriglobales bacterium]